MGHLKRPSPFAIFICELTFLISTFSTPVRATGIVDACMCSAHHGFRLKFFHHISNWLTRPHTILTDRSARQQFTYAYVSDISTSQLGSGLTNGHNPLCETISFKFSEIIVARDML